MTTAVARNAGTTARATAALAVTGGMAVTMAVSAEAAPIASTPEAVTGPITGTIVIAPPAANAGQAVQRVPALTPAPAKVTRFHVVRLLSRKAPPAAPARKAASRTVVTRKATTTRNGTGSVVTRPASSYRRSAVTNRGDNVTHTRARRSLARRHSTARVVAKRTAITRTEARRSVNTRKVSTSRRSHGGVLSIAANLTGIWYRYGGATPSGFDCSGYTSYVFAKVGVNLPRTARGQQRVARRVSNPVPGDLVFFGYPAHHVGIYAGNGMMYDSPRSGKKTQYRKIFSSNVSYGRVR